MDDIGEAAGISGPALYRHFKSKQQMLAEMLVEPTDRLTRAARAAAEAARSPIKALEALVDFHVRFTGEEVNIALVYYRCVEEMAPDDRARLEAKLDVYIGLWIEQIRRLRPDLSREISRSAVMALFRMFNVPYDERRRAARHHDNLMNHFAKAALKGLLAMPK